MDLSNKAEREGRQLSMFFKSSDALLTYESRTYPHVCSKISEQAGLYNKTKGEGILPMDMV